MNNWSELIASSQPLMSYLHRGDYFGRAYVQSGQEVLVTNDSSVGINYATNDSFDQFDEWQTVSDSPAVFSAEFEWKRWIDFNLQKNNYFDLAKKNFHGADLKWTRDGGCLLIELMHRDIRILLNCYANSSFPVIWKEIQAAYPSLVSLAVSVALSL